jgi:hypothetical protein
MQMKFISNVVTKGAGIGRRQVRATISTAAVDRVGDILVPRGCVTRGSSVPVFVDHDSRIESLVGRATISVSDYAVTALINFLDEGVSAKADDCLAKYKASAATDFSVGFNPISSTPRRGGGLQFDEWEILEASCVGVACNPEAVVIERNYVRRSGRASSYSERQAEIAAFRDSAPSAPPKMSARSAYLLTEAERVLDMSVRLYDSDHDANRARRIVEVARLRG